MATPNSGGESKREVAAHSKVHDSHANLEENWHVVSSITTNDIWQRDGVNQDIKQCSYEFTVQVLSFDPTKYSIMFQNKHGDKRRLSKWMDYGTINGEGQSDPCPTCQGTGRIPRGQENQLVAVIPCSDQRLKPHHTKLYVCISVGLCLLICSLILFFLFPRSMDMSAVELQSSMVYFTPDSVKMVVSHEMNLTNQNFVSIKADNLSVQALIFETVVGKTKFPCVTILPPRSQKTIKVIANIIIEDTGLNNYCKSVAFQIHTLFLHLQLNIKVSYLSHSEEMSTDVYEYIDCGVNSTTPHHPLL